VNPARALARSKSKIRPFKVKGGVVDVRHGIFHVRGTVHAASRSALVRRSLHIAAIRENIDAATSEAEQVLLDARLALGGVVPRAFSEVALGYLKQPRKRNKPLGASTVAIIKELVAHFGTRVLRDIPGPEFVAFVDERNVGNTAETRERYLNPVVALLTVAISAGQYPELPAFIRNQEARNPTTRKTRPVERVGANIVSAIFRSSHIANTAQYAVEEVTGARVSSILFGCALADLDLAPNQMKLHFHDTKGGFDVVSALPEAIRRLLEAYLIWRDEQVRAGRVGPGSDEPLFLTPHGVPYVKNDSYTGTRNKTAWRAAKRRAAVLIAWEYDQAIAACEGKDDRPGADALRRQKADDLVILGRMTQHWWRHLLATTLGRLDPKAAMRQGGWKDPRSLSGYMMSDAEYQRELVEKRGVTDWRGPDWHESDTQEDK
jgi:hypothetical protein